MLSFTALSEASIGESTTVLDANAFMSGASATASAGALGQSGETSLGSVTASVVKNDTVVNLTVTPTAVTATLAVHQFTAQDDVRGATGAHPSGQATATITVGTNTATGKASIVPPAATSITTAGTADFDAKANITLDAATADADLTVNVFDDEDAQASTTLSGVSATTAANWDTDDGIYAVQVVFTATDFERKRCVNIVPYGNYKVYVTR